MIGIMAAAGIMAARGVRGEPPPPPRGAGREPREENFAQKHLKTRDFHGLYSASAPTRALPAPEGMHGGPAGGRCWQRAFGARPAPAVFGPLPHIPPPPARPPLPAYRCCLLRRHRRSTPLPTPLLPPPAPPAPPPPPRRRAPALAIGVAACGARTWNLSRLQHPPRHCRARNAVRRRSHAEAAAGST